MRHEFWKGENLWPSLQLAIGQNADANRWIDVTVGFWGNYLLSALIFSKVRSHVESLCQAYVDLFIDNEQQNSQEN